MKITDFGILFVIIFIGIYVPVYIDCSNSGKIIMENEMNNRVLDEISVDVLNEAFTDMDDNLEPIIDRDVVIKEINRETNFLLKNDDILNGIIIIDSNKYYLYSDGKWYCKELKTEELHSERMVDINKLLEDAIGNEKFKITLPINDGETNKQAVSEYALILLYNKSVINAYEMDYRIYGISAAAIKEIE